MRDELASVCACEHACACECDMGFRKSDPIA